jgi:transcriptional regulator GlxA family with amidase domain
MKHLLGISPADFLREARMKRAVQLLRTTDKTVSEVAFAVGFNDPKYFSRCFRQSIGQSPSDMKHISA